MVTIRFRLVKAGLPEEPVRVFPVTEEDGALVFHESEFVESLPTSKPLDQLTIDDLPNWLLKQGLPLALTAPQEVTAGDDADAWMEVCREASRAYRGKGEAVRDAA